MQLPTFLALIMFVGCTDKGDPGHSDSNGDDDEVGSDSTGDDDEAGSTELDLAIEYGDPVVTDADGFAEILIDIPTDAHSIQIGATVEPDGLTFQLLGVFDPSGEEMMGPLEGAVPEVHAGMQLPWGSPVLVVDWARGDSGDVPAGTWAVQVVLTDSEDLPRPDVPVTPYVATNNTPVAQRGVVDIRLIDATTYGGETGHEAWLDELIAEVSGVYADIGITLNIAVETVSGEAGLGPPWDGHDDYQLLSEESGGLVVIVGDGWSDGNPYRAGQVGTIPLALAPTPHSAMVVSVQPHVELGISDLVADTVIHELGHVLGLVHTAQFDAEGDLTLTDALSDTSVASTWEASVNDLDVCTNYMFPDSSCAMDYVSSQRSFSPQQVAAMKRFTGMR